MKSNLKIICYVICFLFIGLIVIFLSNKIFNNSTQPANDSNIIKKLIWKIDLISFICNHFNNSSISDKTSNKEKIKNNDYHNDHRKTSEKQNSSNSEKEIEQKKVQRTLYDYTTSINK